MESDIRAQRKAWRQRNSDGVTTFEGVRTQAPPAFDEDEEALPSTPRLANPDDDIATAIRHTHVFDPSLSDPDA